MKKIHLLWHVLPRGSGVPSFSTNKISSVAGPADSVLTTSFVGVGDITGPISPEGVVVAVVGARGAWGPSAYAEKLAGSGEGSDDGRNGNEEGGEGYHHDD